MSNVRSSTLSLLMALLAAMTLSLPVRAEVCSGPLFGMPSGQSTPAQARSEAGAEPGPAPTPLCHLRCRGFVASVPDSPQQPHMGTAAVLEIRTIYLLLAVPTATVRQATMVPPGASPPRFTILRL